WSTLFPTGYSGIDINRDDTVIENLTGQLLSYSDTSVVCKINYCYTIDAIHTDGSVSRSNQVCDLAFSTTAPSSVNNISAQINDDNTINWYWLPPVGEDVKYYKIYSSSSVLSDSTSVTNISSEWNNDASNCLQIDLINNCDVPSGLIDPVCPLEVSRYFNSDGSVTLSWEDYLGWNNGVNGYALVIYDQNLIQQDSLLLGSELQYTDPLPDGNEQVSYFRVWAIPEDASLVPSGSNIIEIIRPPVIAIPNSFTPNGDNINDVFAITGKYIESVELSIFNRWGALIYHVNGSSWDGMIGGKKVPLGTYIYNVVVKDFAGYEHIRNGTVLILKD
ncbi:MAG: gliding motility-associated C-terminal domain-containing protein, partial [Bacteroidota bacterium]